ncbi:MAG: MFS transporter, partial [Deltaproteobacteria bacterium]|nr:MFS transporter [Deltaproteobacteria bacterium]
MIGVVGAVQFVNILDFMMVMPLGPDFAVELGVDPNHLGVIGGAYTAAAAVGGVIGAFVLDRFDRRRALGLCMMILALGTAAGALAWDLPSMVA